jgi:hypothetical protein
MKTFDGNQELNGARPRWRTPRLTCDSIGVLTGNDNPPGAPFDGHVGTYNNTQFHENS